MCHVGALHCKSVWILRAESSNLFCAPQTFHALRARAFYPSYFSHHRNKVLSPTRGRCPQGCFLFFFSMSDCLCQNIPAQSFITLRNGSTFAPWRSSRVPRCLCRWLNRSASVSRSSSQVSRDFTATPWTPSLPKRVSVCHAMMRYRYQHCTTETRFELLCCTTSFAFRCTHKNAVLQFG